MKTKIIYISGSEIFNINDIHTAFDEVREALQLGPDTVLFGVPVDKEDAGFGVSTTEEKPEIIQEKIIEPETAEEPVEIIESVETVVEETPKETKPKRNRTRKTTKAESTETTESETLSETTETPEITDDSVEKIVPILSVLSTKDENEETKEEETEIISDISEETEVIPTESETEESNDVITEIDENPETENEGEPDLEKLLSAMTPLQEDVLDEDVMPVDTQTSDSDENVSDDVDATLEQLATEFAETQDKIAAENKSSGRGKIGKLRNILPFKQSKHKDQGLGDLFGWAGVAANDEDFSVPGFFTNASSKK